MAVSVDRYSYRRIEQVIRVRKKEQLDPHDVLEYTSRHHFGIEHF